MTWKVGQRSLILPIQKSGQRNLIWHEKSESIGSKLGEMGIINTDVSYQDQLGILFSFFFLLFNFFFFFFLNKNHYAPTGDSYERHHQDSDVALLSNSDPEKF